MFNLIFLLLFVLDKSEGGLNPELFRDCLASFNQARVNAVIELPSIDDTPLFTRNFNPLLVIGGGGGDFVTNVVAYLKAATKKFQAPIIRAIQSLMPGIIIEQFWIVNRLAVNDVTCGLMTAISLIPGVLEVRRQGVYHVDTHGSAKLHAQGRPTCVTAKEPQWGISKIKATEIWRRGEKGRGVIIANIDSGVRGTHEVLRDNFRGGDFSWLDAYTDSTNSTPDDGNGHGTHTMGTICGTNGVGVAPEATWIACKGCNEDGECEEQPLLKCGQWVMCPYKIVNGQKTENCKKRPKIVSNSWGGGGTNTGSWYNTVIRRWQLAGITPIFSIGNRGSRCGSAGSPGDQASVISVGATDKDDKLAQFSSRGPTKFYKGKKPEISAPGVGIMSAWNTGDSEYATLDGTSMAAPHAAGTAALLMGKKHNLTFQNILSALYQTAVQPTDVPNWNSCNIENCSEDDSECYNNVTTYPNNGYGNGRINARSAYHYV